MKHLMPLVALVAGCASSSFRDKVVRDRLTTIESELAAVHEIDAAEMLLSELASAIGARKKELDALKVETLALLAKKEELFEMAAEVTQVYDDLKIQQGNLEVGEITAQELTIVNSAGEPAVQLGTSVDGDGDIVLLSETGKEVFSVGVDSDGSGGILTVSNKVGTQMFKVSCADGEGGAVSLFNKDGRLTVYVAVFEKEASLEIMGQDPNIAASIGSLEDGRGYLSINNDTGQPAVRAYADDEAYGHVEVFDGEI